MARTKNPQVQSQVDQKHVKKAFAITEKVAFDTETDTDQFICYPKDALDFREEHKEKFRYFVLDIVKNADTQEWIYKVFNLEMEWDEEKMKEYYDYKDWYKWLDEERKKQIAVERGGKMKDYTLLLPYCSKCEEYCDPNVTKVGNFVNLFGHWYKDESINKKDLEKAAKISEKTYYDELLKEKKLSVLEKLLGQHDFQEALKFVDKIISRDTGGKAPRPSEDSYSLIEWEDENPLLLWNIFLKKIQLTQLKEKKLKVTDELMNKFGYQLVENGQRYMYTLGNVIDATTVDYLDSNDFLLDEKKGDLENPITVPIVSIVFTICKIENEWMLILFDWYKGNCYLISSTNKQRKAKEKIEAFWRNLYAHQPGLKKKSFKYKWFEIAESNVPGLSVMYYTLVFIQRITMRFSLRVKKFPWNESLEEHFKSWIIQKFG